MKFCLSTKICKEKGIDIDALCYLLSLYFDSPITDETLEKVKEQYLVTDYDSETGEYSYTISQNGIDLVESVMLDSEFKQSVAVEDKYDSLAIKMIELFPKGRKEGTNCMWRDSKIIIAKRLRALVKNTGIILNEEEVLDATKRYVTSFNGDYTLMRVLKYFISKKDKITGEESSELLSFMENKEDVIRREKGDLI